MTKGKSRLVCGVDSFDFLHCKLNRTHEKPLKVVLFVHVQPK
jgi:hypothetical protein